MKEVEAKEDIISAVIKLKKGEKEGFDEIYRSTCNRVYFRARQLLGNEEEAKDLVQIVYIEVYKNISGLQTPEAFYTWLDKIIYNQYTKQIRKKSEVLLTEEGYSVLEEVESEDLSTFPESMAEQKETSRIVKEIINELPELQAVTISLYYYDQLKIEQIAEIMSCSANTVKSRLYYAKNYIKQRVTEKQKSGKYKLYTINAPVLWMAVKMWSDENELSDIQRKELYEAIDQKIVCNNQQLRQGKEKAVNKTSKKFFEMKWIIGISLPVIIVAMIVTVIVVKNSPTESVEPIESPEVTETAAYDELPDDGIQMEEEPVMEEDELYQTYITSQRRKENNRGCEFKFDYPLSWSISNEDDEYISEYPGVNEYARIDNGQGVGIQYIDMDRETEFGWAGGWGTQDWYQATVTKIKDLDFKPLTAAEALGKEEDSVSLMLAQITVDKYMNLETDEDYHAIDEIVYYTLIPNDMEGEYEISGYGGFYEKFIFSKEHSYCVISYSKNGAYTEQEKKEVLKILSSFDNSGYFDKSVTEASTSYQVELNNLLLTSKYCETNQTDGTIHSINYPDNWIVEEDTIGNMLDNGYFEKIVLSNERGVKIYYFYGIRDEDSDVEDTWQIEIKKVADSSYEPGYPMGTDTDCSGMGNFMVAEVDILAGDSSEHSDKAAYYAVLPESRSGTYDVTGTGNAIFQVLGYEYPRMKYAIVAVAPEDGFTEREKQEIIAILSSYWNTNDY